MASHLSPTEQYRALSDQVFQLYSAGDYQEALDLIEAAPLAVVPWLSEIVLLQACVLAAKGDAPEALRILTLATEDGAWWAPYHLEQDHDLASVRELPGFDAVLEESRARWAAANSTLDRSADILLMPRGVEPTGLIMALHGADQEPDDAVKAWAMAVNSGLALAAVRSSQLESPRYHSWTDQARAAADIADAYANLSDDLQALPVIAAGFDAGGRAALLWALEQQPIPVVGVLAVAPTITVDELPDAQPELFRATIVVGDQDPMLEETQRIHERLEPLGVTLEVIPHHGHTFPDGFSARLAEWLSG